jgi:hypothetical protein
VDELLKALASNGPIGIIAAIMIWQNFNLTNKVTSVLESNTAALQAMKDAIDNLKNRQ